ncbi:MAG TPA: phospholipase C, phosphocholine-specific, partial [Burkholderiaceae bacterium]
MTQSSRRGFLTASAATALSGVLPLGLRNALAARPAGTSLSAVKHVVVFMQENRSFDHYFGTLQGVRGYNDPAALMLNGGGTVFKQSGVLGTYWPFHMDTSKTSAQCVIDLDHSWTTQHWGVNNGRMDLWIDAKTPMTMGGYNRADIPFHFALADAFTICDQYFCSVLGPTDPNRLYLWTGMIDPHGTGGGPAIDNSTPGYTWTTYPERLQAAGVSWKVYQNANDNYGDNPLALFKQYQAAQPGNPLHDRGMGSVPVVTGDTVADIAAAIKADVLNGTLPQVSWVVAPESASEHPSGSPAAGADMINQVLESLTADPNVWASTVMFVNYDENDGFFDHAVPPLPPSGTPDEFVNGLPIGLGVRVPMTVVSPWSRGGHVCSQVFDHTSVIRFLEKRFGVIEPNISPWRRAVCGDLT